MSNIFEARKIHFVRCCAVTEICCCRNYRNGKPIINIERAARFVIRFVSCRCKNRRNQLVKIAIGALPSQNASKAWNQGPFGQENVKKKSVMQTTHI